MVGRGGRGETSDRPARRCSSLRSTLALSVVGLVLAGCSESVSSPEPAPELVVGRFVDASGANLPVDDLKGRCMDATNGDGDGDLDLVLAQENATNLVLLNDGDAVFAIGSLEGGDGDNEDVRLACDGLVELLIGNAGTNLVLGLRPDGSLVDETPSRPIGGDGGGIEVWANRGDGSFEAPPVSPFATEPSGSTFDVEVADFNDDGAVDLYFCNRTGSDQLYLGG